VLGGGRRRPVLVPPCRPAAALARGQDCACRPAAARGPDCACRPAAARGLDCACRPAAARGPDCACRLAAARGRGRWLATARVGGGAWPSGAGLSGLRLHLYSCKTQNDTQICLFISRKGFAHARRRLSLSAPAEYPRPYPGRPSD